MGTQRTEPLALPKTRPVHFSHRSLAFNRGMFNVSTKLECAPKLPEGIDLAPPARTGPANEFGFDAP